jgi:hypothetical protein
MVVLSSPWTLFVSFNRGEYCEWELHIRYANTYPRMASRINNLRVLLHCFHTFSEIHRFEFWNEYSHLNRLATSRNVCCVCQIDQFNPARIKILLWNFKIWANGKTNISLVVWSSDILHDWSARNISLTYKRISQMETCISLIQLCCCGSYMWLRMFGLLANVRK